MRPTSPRDFPTRSQLIAGASKDHVIPDDELERVKWELSEGYDQQMDALPADQRPANELVLQPTFARHVCHPVIVAIAQTLLDSHLRIANVGHRNLPSDDQMPAGELGGFGPPENRGPNGREYHTDWPHDLSDRGKFATGGPIRQPFPDGERSLLVHPNVFFQSCSNSRRCAHSLHGPLDDLDDDRDWTRLRRDVDSTVRGTPAPAWLATALMS